MTTIVCTQDLCCFNPTVGPFPRQFRIATHKEVYSVIRILIHTWEGKPPKDRHRRKLRSYGVKAYLTSSNKRYKRFRRGPSETLVRSSMSSRNDCAAKIYLKEN